MPNGARYWYGCYVTSFSATDTRTSGSGGAQAVPTITNNTNTFVVAAGGQASQGSYLTDVALDLTNYSSLRFLTNAYSVTGSYGALALLVTDISALTSDQYMSSVYYALSKTTSSTTTIYSLDVSALSSSYICGIYGTSTYSITVSAIWYE